MNARRIQVHGRVQGVFFRAHTRDEAQRLGLTGWVRNLPDGRVEIWAQGDDSALDALVRWCRAEGSPMSQVDQVDAFPCSFDPTLREFVVRR